MDRPSVSVILPTYNRAALIGEAIQSVLAQTYRDFELVVADDGSTDDTELVIGAYADPRIVYIPSEVNRGIAAARNLALTHARGRYIAFLDSDDVWRPELLMTQIDFLEEHPEIGAVYASAQGMDTTRGPRPQREGVPPRFPDDFYVSILYGNCVNITTLVVRKTCIDCAGHFDESLVARVDWDLSVRLAACCDFHFIDEVLADFRMHEKRTTGRHSEVYQDVLLSRLKALDKAYSRPDLPQRAQKVKPLAYRNAYIDTGLQWLNLRAWGEAMGAFRRAYGYDRSVSTLLRILYLIVFYNVLSKSKLGTRIAGELVGAARMIRSAGQSSSEAQ
jgi:glycosyltransferase involved in cell wall biosynthesis